MLQNRKKLWKKICLIASAAILLLVAAGGALFWYMPQRWLNAVSTDYLVRNQSMIRAGKVSKAGVNKLILQDLELGISGRELFSAPQAELILGYNPRHKLDKPQFKILRLANVPLEVKLNNKELAINGHTLQSFINDLMQLPKAPDGRMIPLEINAFLKLNNSDKASELQLVIDFETQQKIKFTALWKHAHHSGKWVAHLDLTNENLTALLSDDLSLRFFKELLLRAKLPEKSVKLLHAGSIKGSGQFSAKYPELEVTHLQYSGEMSTPEIKWYSHKTQKCQPFKFALRKDLPHTVLTIPELTFQAPGTVKLRQIKAQYHSRQSQIKFSAQCDLRQAMVNYFCQKLNIAEIPVNAAWENFSGSWNHRTNRWKFAGSLAKQSAKQTLQLHSAANNGLQMIPGEAQLTAEGSGSSGKILYQLNFTDLQLRTTATSCRAASGKFYATAVLSNRTTAQGDSLEFDFTDFAADSLLCQIDLPRLSGAMNLRKLAGDEQEIYFIGNGNNGSLFAPGKTLQWGNWQCSLSMESRNKRQSWYLAGMDFSIPQVKINYNGNKFKLTQASIRGNGIWEKNLFTPENMFISAQTLTGEKCSVQAPEVQLKSDPALPTSRRCQVKFKCKSAQLPENRFKFRKLTNAEITFANHAFTRQPTELKIQAEALKIQYDNWHCDMINSSWQIQDTPSNCETKIKFGHMLLNSEQKQFGNGSFSSGSMHIQLQKKNPQQINKIKLSIDAQQPAWQYTVLHAGGGKLQCSLLWQPHATPRLQSSFKITEATMLAKDFSIMAPEMTGSVLSGKSGSISGNLQLLKSTLSSLQGDLELRNTNIVLPFLAAEKQPSQLKKGSINAQDVFFKHQHEGSFDADIEHFWLLNPRTGQSGRHFIKITGNMRSSIFNNARISIRSQRNLPPASDSVSWQFSMPESQLQIPLELHKYLPLPTEAAVLKGKLALKGNISITGNEKPRGEITLQTRESDWQSNALFLENVNSDARIALQHGKTSLVPHNVTAAKLLWHNWLLLDNEFTFTLTPDWQMLIAGWHGKYQDGKFKWTMPIKLDAVQLKNPAALSVPTVQVDVQDLSSGDFFRQLGIKYMLCNMKVSGQLHIRMQDGRLFFDESTLAGKAPQGELLQLQLPDQNMIKIRDRQYQAFTLAVLKAMKCTRTQFTFTTDTSEINMQVKADGTPAEGVPFVYQGRGKSPFRPAQAGEKGFDGEIELNINLKLRPDKTGI